MAERAPTSADANLPVVSVSEGEYVFRAGDAAGSFFVITVGKVELLRRGETYGRLALLDAGEVCGEDSAFEGQVRSYDARALTSATLIEVNDRTFVDVVRLRPELAGVIISRTGARLLRARAAALAIALPAGRTADARFVHVESGLQFALPAEDAVLVGRADPRSKLTPGVELSSVDEHRSLSRRHATVTREGGGYRIAEERQVANGTFVNGSRLAAGAPVPLKDGDEVSFGLIRTIFRTT